MLNRLLPATGLGWRVNFTAQVSWRSSRMFPLLGSGGAIELSEIEVHGDLGLTNYAFVPARAAAEFRRDFCKTSGSAAR